MDLVDEEDVARLQIGQQRGEIAGALDDRPGGRAEADAQLARDDLRQRRLAEAGRAVEQHVIERLAALARRRDEDAEIVAELALPDELVERQRTERRLRQILLGARALDHALLADHALAVAHGASSLRPPRIRASIPASVPSLRAAREIAPEASTRR